MNTNEALSQDSRTSYFFHGKFVPERANIWFNYSNRGAKFPDREVQYSVFAFGSEFNGKIVSTVPFENMLAVHSAVYLLLRSMLDRICYLNACGYDIDLIGAVSTQGQEHQIFGVYEPIYFNTVDEQLDYSRKQIPFIDELIDLKFHDIRLDHALRCFCHAMRDDALTALFCYIAIEALARRVAEIVEGKQVDDVGNSEWIKFTQNLNLKASTVKDEVKTLADDFRHGNFVNTTWEARKKMLSLTWEIIRRAMHFIRTKSALAPSSFPEL